MINLIDLLSFRATLLSSMDFKRNCSPSFINSPGYINSTRVSDTFILDYYYIRDTIYEVLND